MAAQSGHRSQRRAGARTSAAESYSRLRHPISAGVAGGELARLSVVWLPSPPAGIKEATLRLAVLDLNGKPLASKQLTLKQGAGAFIDYKPTSRKRQQVWGYVWIDGLTEQEYEYVAILGGLELVDAETGRTRLLYPVGIG